MPQPTRQQEILLYKQLFEQTRQGFDMLYDLYSAPLYGSIFGILNDEEQSTAMLSEVIVTAFNHIRQFNPRTQRLPVWLLNMARKKAMAFKQVNPPAAGLTFSVQYVFAA